MSILSRLVLLSVLAVALLVACDDDEPNAAPPQGFEGSCAEDVRPWDEVQDDPLGGESFACVDAPDGGADIQPGTTIRVWAGYPYTPDIVMQLQVVDPLGRRALQSFTYHFDDDGSGFSFVKLEEVIPIPRDAPPGDELRIVVIVGNQQTGDGLANTEVTLRLGQ